MNLRDKRLKGENYTSGYVVDNGREDIEAAAGSGG